MNDYWEKSPYFYWNMRYSYDFYKSIVVLNRKLKLETFLTLTGAEKGYAREMFTRMYEGIFSELIDLESERLRFYGFEYNSLEQYLYRKFNLPEEDIGALMKMKAECEDYGIFRTDDLAYGDSGVNQLAFSEMMNNRIDDILLLKTLPV